MILKYFIFLSILLLPAIGFSQTINITDSYVRPQLMSSSDGRGGSTSTYFHFHGNQVDKINEKFSAYESYTIINRKQTTNAVYYTIKGNNKGNIYYLTIRSSKTKSNKTANELIFESPGDFKETYMAF